MTITDEYLDDIVKLFLYPGVQLEIVRVEELLKHRCQLFKPGTDIKKLRGQKAFDNARCPNHTTSNLSIRGHNPTWICADHLGMIADRWKELKPARITTSVKSR